MKKWLIVLVILLIGIGTAGYLWFHHITSKIFIPQNLTMKAGTQTPLNTIDQHLADKTPINILLLGYGGGNHDGAYLTDSIIAVHIDPKIKKVFLISIPRDTWVKIPTDGTDGSYSKINAAYQDGLDDTSFPNKQPQFKDADGGGKLAEYMVTQVTGLPFDYFVGMDFAGFTHTIDTLGGVDITVQKTFDDYAYPIEGQEDATCGHTSDEIASLTAQLASPSANISEVDAFPCRYEHLHFDAGPQHMDGTRALKYVRSRHSLQDGTDFGRSERQRNLLVAVKQKIFSAGFIPQTIPFITSLGDDLRTDLSMDDVRAFIQNANTLNKYEIVNLALTDQNYLVDAVTPDGQDVLESKDSIDSWNSTHAWIASQISGKPQLVSAVVQVENGTHTAGLASTAVNNLKQKNIQVLDPTNASTQNALTTTITVYDKNVNPTDLATIEKEFGKSTVTYATATQTGYNVLVVIGSDYTNQSISPTP